MGSGPQRPPPREDCQGTAVPSSNGVLAGHRMCRSLALGRPASGRDDKHSLCEDVPSQAGAGLIRAVTPGLTPGTVLQDRSPVPTSLAPDKWPALRDGGDISRTSPWVPCRTQAPAPPTWGSRLTTHPWSDEVAQKHRLAEQPCPFQPRTEGRGTWAMGSEQDGGPSPPPSASLPGAAPPQGPSGGARGAAAAASGARPPDRPTRAPHHPV